MSVNTKFRMLLLVASFLSYQGIAQPILKLWDKTIGGNFPDYNIANMLITPSKNITIACLSASDAGFDKTASRKDTLYCSGTCYGTWVFTLDKFGHKLWDQTYGGSMGTGTNTTVFGMVQQNTNSFLLGCSIWATDSSGDLTDPYTYPNSISGQGIWILNIDSLGNKLWNKRYCAHNMAFYFNDMILNDDNLYIATRLSSLQNNPPQYGNIFIPPCYQTLYNNPGLIAFKINIQNKIFNWSFYHHSPMKSLLKSKANQLLMGGWSDSILVCNKTMNTNGIYDFGIIATDTLGNILWQKNYGGSKYDRIMDVIATNDGGYMLYGWTFSPQGFDVSQTSSNDTSLWVVKVDSLGMKLWDKRFGSCLRTGGSTLTINGYGKYETSHLAINTSDGGFLFATNVKGAACGDVTEAARGTQDYWLLKIDHDGVKLWDKRFGSLGSNRVESLSEMDTGIYVVSGSTRGGIGGDKTEASRGYDDIWLICFADTTVANLTSINEIANTNSTLTVWPNPASDILNYELTGNEKIKNITLSNMLGEKVMEVNLPTSKAIQINTLQAGVYIFNCETTKGKRYVKKVMVTK